MNDEIAAAYQAERPSLETVSTRQVGQRIRRGTLPVYSPGGRVACAEHPDHLLGDTEALSFWAKGDHIGCERCGHNSPALAVHEALGIIIDTRL